jgi:hypothetical protein
MREDIGSYKVNNFASEYFVNINQLIQMTIQQARQGLPKAKDSFVVDPFQALDPRHQLIDFSSKGDSFRLEVALCLLWTWKSELVGIKMIQKIRNKDNRAILQHLDNLIGIIKNQFVGLTEMLYGQDTGNNKDFVDLAIDRAFLHTNMKKYNPFYGFGSVVASMLDLYERTKIHTIKDTIVGELMEIKGKYNRDDESNFGPYGDKIKDFSRSLRTILNRK